MESTQKVGNGGVELLDANDPLEELVHVVLLDSFNGLLSIFFVSGRN